MYMTSPSVYLDYSVIGMLARDTVRSESFRNILFRKQGTLVISAAHLVEACGLGLGPTFSNIKSFLDSIENKFVIMDFNPYEVIKKEKDLKPGDACPAFDPELAKQVLHQWSGLSPLSAGTLLNILLNNPELSNRFKEFQIQQKLDLKDIFDKARSEYRNSAVARKNIDELDCTNFNFNRTEQINCLLRRETIRTNEAFNETDGLDFWHAVVATSYTNYIVHNKKWARRLRAINLPPEAATVFAGVEIDSFLRSLAA